MGGVSIVTAQEILENPFDILVEVGFTETGKTWSYVIDRGPAGRHKRLLQGAGYARPEEAISAVCYVLTCIRVRELERLRLTSDGDREFSDKLITWVETELKRCRRAATWEKIPQ